MIVAGYTELMKAFIASNPGLQSRFNKYLEFADYSPSELTAIFEQLAMKNDYVFDDECLQSVLLLFESLHRVRDEKFGNGRLARNIFERAIGNHADRLSMLAKIDDADLSTIRAEDIPIENSLPCSNSTKSELV